MKIKLPHDFGRCVFLALTIGGCAIFVMWMVILCIDDIYKSKTADYQGVVVDRAYSPSSTQTGVGFAGKNAVATTSTAPELWIVIVNINGVICPTYATSTQWAESYKGQSVTVGDYTGKITGWHYAYCLQ